MSAMKPSSGSHSGYIYDFLVSFSSVLVRFLLKFNVLWLVQRALAYFGDK